MWVMETHHRKWDFIQQQIMLGFEPSMGFPCFIANPLTPAKYTGTPSCQTKRSMSHIYIYVHQYNPAHTSTYISFAGELTSAQQKYVQKKSTNQPIQRIIKWIV